MKRTVLILLSIAAVGLTTGMPAHAQTTGRLRGTVVDLDKLSVPGVTVTITSEVLMGGARMAVTGTTGAYRFTALPPGIYTATAELDGFETSSFDGVRVAINATADVHFVLQPAEIIDVITVTGEAPLVDVASSSVGTNFTSKFLQDLPTARNQTDMMAVSPGTTIGMEDNPAHITAFGSDLGSNTFSVDGIDFSSPEAGSNWLMFNPDSIEEIQVLGVGAPAEFGNMQGAAFNVVTKSGSNELQGLLNAYWFNDALVDSDIDFDGSEFSEYEQVEPFLDLTATLGGAIKQDRLWYFVALESIQDTYAFPGQDPATASSLSEQRYDLKLSTRINDRNLLDFKGGVHERDVPYSPDEFTESSATRGWLDKMDYWALNFQSIFSDRTFLEARGSVWKADLESLSLTGSTDPAYIDYSPPDGGPVRFSGGLWWPFLYDTGSDNASVTVSHFADDFLQGDHDFKFGVQLSRGDTTAKTSPSATGTYYTHYYFEPYDYYYKVEGRPYYHGNEQEAWGVFVDDSWAVTSRLTMNLGLRFDHAKGIIPSYPILTTEGDPTGETAPALDPAFTWDNWSPRIGFAYNAGATRRTVIRGSVGVYYDGIVGGTFNGPPLYAPTLTAYVSDSPNGPFDTVAWEWNQEVSGNIDPDLKAPRTLQYSLGFEREFKSVYSYGAMVVFKDSKDGIGWEILNDGTYETFDWTDPFTEQQYTLLDPVIFPTIRKSNGPGFTVEGDLDNYWAEYKGLILTFNRRFSGW